MTEVGSTVIVLVILVLLFYPCFPWSLAVRDCFKKFCENSKMSETNYQIKFKINEDLFTLDVPVSEEELLFNLTNNDGYASSYLLNLIKSDFIKVPGVVRHICRVEDDTDILIYSEEDNTVEVDNNFNNSGQEIWIKKKATERDTEATRIMLEIRSSDKYLHLFNDKKHAKGQLWNKIANEMSSLGFIMGEKGGEKCRQKFANLQKNYMAFMSNCNQTGAGAIDEPKYFDYLHEIMGEKHKVKPPLVIDSINDVNSIVDDESPSNSLEISEEPTPSTNVLQKNKSLNKEPTPSTSKDTSERNRFLHVKQSVRPKTNTVELLEDINSTQKKLFDYQKNIMTEILKETKNQNEIQNEYKIQLLHLIENIFTRKRHNNKRKRSSSSDDE